MFRPRPHRRPPVLALVLALLGLLLPSGRSVLAQEPGTCFEWEDLRLEAGTQLECDLVLIGGSLYLEEGAGIDGSVNVPTGSARIDGRVEGDVWVGRDLDIDGQIEGSVAALAGRIELQGRVGGDLVALAGEIEIGPEALVEGDLTGAGDVVLAGRVEGDVNAGGDLRMSDAAEIDGDATVGGELERSSEARIGGQEAEAGSEGDSRLSQLIWGLTMVLFAAIFGALAVSVLPRATGRVRAAASASPLLMVFLGLLSLVILPFMSLLVLPLLAYLVAAAIGLVGVGEAIGQRLRPSGGRGFQSALGTGLLSLLAAAALVLATLGGLAPFCGAALLLLAIFTLPLGAGFATLFGRRDWGPAASAPDPGVPGESRVSAPLPEAESAPAPAVPSVALGAEPSDELSDEPLAAVPESEDAASEPLELDAAERLREVPGISPVFASLLAEAGIDSVEALAGCPPERLVALVSAPGVMTIDRSIAEDWIRAAQAYLARD